MKYTKNYSLYKPDENDFYDVKKRNDNWDTIDEELSKRPTDTGDVSNMKTTFTQVSNLANVVSGEKLSVSFGKIAKAITSLISHLADSSNPHSVTKAQVGLGNVDNTADENKSVKYATSAGSATKAEQDANGNVISDTYAEKADFTSHLANTSNPHSVTKSQVGLGNVENKSSATIRGELTKANVTNALGFTPINSTIKGVANGLAELDENGVVPSSQLPSYVDDVLEYSSISAFPATGVSGKIYIANDTNLTYRWSGSTYTEISKSLALGTTSSTAYRGDRGSTAYTHSQKTSGNPHGVTKSDVGLGNVPNVATNDQAPTYTVVSSNTALTSGEKLSVAFGKIAKAINSLISHLASTSNPHSVTKAQVGLGNVDNTADSNKSVKYATSAGSATKATQDASGNVITSTYLKIANIVNNLTSTSTNAPLSAKQGSILREKINDIIFDIKNLGVGKNLSTSTTTKTINVPSGAVTTYELAVADEELLISVSGYVSYDSHGTGYRTCNLQIGNEIIYANNVRPIGNNVADNIGFNGLYHIPEGQSLKLILYQTSGVALNATIKFTQAGGELLLENL